MKNFSIPSSGQMLLIFFFRAYIDLIFMDVIRTKGFILLDQVENITWLRQSDGF